MASQYPFQVSGKWPGKWKKKFKALTDFAGAVQTLIYIYRHCIF
jgi:hypothetical protein